MAATDKYLWFGNKGVFYYDLKTRKATAISPLEGTRFDQMKPKHISPSPDGRFASPNGWSHYLIWSPGKGLEPLSEFPHGGWKRWIGFDVNNRLLLQRKVNRGNRKLPWFVYNADKAIWEDLDEAPAQSSIPVAVPKQKGLTVSRTKDNRRRWAYTVRLPDGSTLPALLAEPYRRDVPFRDANGDIWLGNWRWDGKAWEQIVPPCYFPFTDSPSNSGLLGSHAAASDRRRCELDKKTMTWRGANPTGDTNIWAYDAKTKRGFREVERQEKWMLQEIEYASPGWKVIREVDVTGYRGVPRLRDKNGDWWWLARDKRGRMPVLRLTKKGLKVYRPKYPLGGNGPRTMSLSPDGQILLWDWVYWQRFDYDKDEFVSLSGKTPLDEFAFTFGPWTLSRVGETGEFAGEVFVKKDKVWKPFRMPGTINDKYGRSTGTRHMIHGRRMLLHWSGDNPGIYEYDLDRGRWECLLSGACLDAGYDAYGRIIIVTQCGVLVFVRHPSIAVKLPDDELRQRFGDVINKMDSSDFRERETASADALAMGNRIAPQIDEVLRLKKRSVEVQTRLKEVLDKVCPKSDLLKPLFREMHPYLTTQPK
jgi:hypothetical protein